VGEIDGVHYPVMAYIEGKPLSDFVRKDKNLEQFFAAAAEEETPLLPRSKPSRPRSKPPWPWLAAAGAAALLVLGVIIYIATNKGTIKIEVNDPTVTVFVDGDEVRIENLGEPITLRAGDHRLIVKRGDIELEAEPRTFTVRRGRNPAIEVQLLKQVDATTSDQLIDASSGGWISIMPTAEEVSQTDGAEYKDGVLTLRNGREFGSRGVKARNFVIRVLVKQLEGGDGVWLTVRQGEAGWYSAWFNRGRGFGVGKWVKSDTGSWPYTILQTTPSPEAFDDYLEFSFKVEGDLLSVEADGEEVIRVRDSTHTAASEVKCFPLKCTAQFKKAEIKILDPATHADMARAAVPKPKARDASQKAQKNPPGQDEGIAEPALLLAPFHLQTAQERQRQWAKYLGNSSYIETNTIGMKMVLIPPGEYLMGSTETAEETLLFAHQSGWKDATLENFSDEYPQHRVRITKPLWLGQYEVTLGQFRQFVHEMQSTHHKVNQLAGHSDDLLDRLTFQQGLNLGVRSG
jgi:hypothetical protein